MAKKVSIYDRIDALLSEFLCEHGYELYHVTLTKEGKDRFLRVFIEKLDLTAGGISTDDCELVSRYLSERLDDDDVVGGDMYYLEVSSPGLDRELVKDAHFERYVGDGIELKLFKAYDGKKHIEAELVSKGDDDICVRPYDENGIAGDEICLPLSQVSKVNLMVVI